MVVHRATATSIAGRFLLGIGLLGIGFHATLPVANAAPSLSEIQQSPDCVGNLSRVDKSLSRLSPDYPVHRIRLLILKARLLRTQRGARNREKAILALKEARKITLGLEKKNPKDPLFWVFLGQIDLLRTRYQGFPGGMRFASRSRKEVTTALSLDPHNPGAHFTRGLEDYFKPWFVGGSKKKALAHFQRALKENPDNPRYLSWTGLALLASHQTEEGRTDIDRAASMCPGNPIYRRRAITQKPRS